MIAIGSPYFEVRDPGRLPDCFVLGDHLGGFDSLLENEILRGLDDFAASTGRHFTIKVDQPYSQELRDRYPRLNLQFDMATFQLRSFWNHLSSYRTHPEIEYKNFVCSFNGSPHVSRKFLVSALHRWGWFDPETSSKNFRFSTEQIDGHLFDYLDDEQSRYYRPFFIASDSADFFDKVYSFGHVQYDHGTNVYNLERQLTQSFLHLVSETLATSFYPFVTEKFLYSVVTRGLYLAYGQPGWHSCLEQAYGFKKYAKIFDYRFDNIQNPVERLIELMSMISKFSILSPDDWRNLYDMELETIEYNHDHYFSKRYLDCLQRC